MTVKFRAVHADKFRFSINRNAAAAAHTGSVNHNSIQRDNGMHSVRACCCSAEFHHNRGPDRNCFLRRSAAFAEFFQRFGNKRFSSVAAVIGNNDELIRNFTHFFFKNDQLFRPAPDDNDNLITGALIGLRNRMQRRNADTAADTDNLTDFFDMSWIAERSENGRNSIAGIFPA